MMTKITFKGLDRSPAVEARVQGHVGKLEQLCHGIARCDVVVETPHRHHRHGRRFRVRVEVAVPGRVIEVSQSTGGTGAHENVYVAVRDAFLAARRQLGEYMHGDDLAA